MSTIAILWPVVKAIFEKRAATVEVDTLISRVLITDKTTTPSEFQEMIAKLCYGLRLALSTGGAMMTACNPLKGRVTYLYLVHLVKQHGLAVNHKNGQTRRGGEHRTGGGVLNLLRKKMGS